MVASRLNLALPRQVVIYYLLFCLVAVVWLVGGAVLVSRNVMHLRAESGCLSLLGRVSTAAALGHVRSGTDGVQEVARRFVAEGQVVQCSVVAPDGTWLAHSNSDLVGRKATPVVGDEAQWGQVRRVRFVDQATARLLRQYETPLRARGEEIGLIRISVAEPSFWSTLAATAEVAPLAVIAPMFCVLGGAFFLRRLVVPFADIDRQLKHLATAGSPDQCTLQRVAATGPAAIGWNRLVDAQAAPKPETDLSSRVEAVLESRRGGKLEDAFNSFSEGLALTDIEGRLTFANRAVASLLGNGDPNDELEGKSIRQLLYAEEEQEDGSVETLFDNEARDRTVIAEVTRTNAVGSRVIRAARCPVRRGSGPAGFAWSFRDVTQQKLAEKMRDQFLDSATHELRTPLANIKAYAETLAISDMMDLEKQKEFCNTINAEATRLSRFIDDLLDLSSIEVGSLSIARQNVDVGRLIREVADKVRPLMSQKEIDFGVKVPEKLPSLWLDKDKIAATLVNLLGNAAKYTPDKGRVVLKVSTLENELQIDVEDTGVGISEEELPRVFEKFFRSADSRVQQESGTGLGLSLANEVVQLHGGDLSVTSELNQGSTFTVTLPLR